jgi:hypothetical protein
MKSQVNRVAFSATFLVVVSVGLSSALVPASASTPLSSDGPITVIIPDTATPTPSPTGGGSGGGSSGGSGGGSGDDFEDVDAPTLNSSDCPDKNADGSPVPPAKFTEDATELTVDQKSLRANEWLIASASEFTRGEMAQVVMYPGAVVIGSYSVDAPTGFSARFRIPQDTLVGVHVIEVTGWESCVVANAEITVIGTPFTSNFLSLIWVYVVLGVLGIGLLSLLIAFRDEIARWFSPQTLPKSTA